jgi:hypothetical protein
VTTRIHLNTFSWKWFTSSKTTWNLLSWLKEIQEIKFVIQKWVRLAHNNSLLRFQNLFPLSQKHLIRFAFISQDEIIRFEVSWNMIPTFLKHGTQNHLKNVKLHFHFRVSRILTKCFFKEWDSPDWRPRIYVKQNVCDLHALLKCICLVDCNVPLLCESSWHYSNNQWLSIPLSQKLFRWNY